MPDSKIPSFAREFQEISWQEVVEEQDLDIAVHNFHKIIVSISLKHFPEKILKISNLDKKWMTPYLKSLSRRIKNEFFRNRKSPKWKRLKKEFKAKKKKAVRDFNYKFVNELKQTNPSRFYQMCKKIGLGDQMNSGDIKVECLKGLSDQECADTVAQGFAAVSNQYEPLDSNKLPAYLPSLPPPQVEEYQVYEKLKRLKNTKSTLPIDIPNKLRNEVAVELTYPLTIIINRCLSEGKFPALWKQEWVSPVPKVPEPQVLKDLRKVACTSDYNKVLESFTKDWIIEDIGKKLDLSQFGGKKGIGPEHMVVAMVDRILRLLDNNSTRSAVIKTGVDWDSAFERGDPTITVQKFLAMGLRPSLVPLVSNYLSGRQCIVKFNSAESNLTQLTGGFPQGSLIGQDAFLVTSDDCADHVDEDDKYRYIDDLEILELVRLTGVLLEYDVASHVPSDIGTHQQFLPPEACSTQSRLDQISLWTSSNLMKLNSKKSNYMVFTRSQEVFATRLQIGGLTIEQKEACKVLGVWITQDAGDWTRNTKEICKSAYARISMLTKLKYVGVGIEDLLEIYSLFI